MFNIKRQQYLYTFALRHSHIQLYKTESPGKQLELRVTSVMYVQ